MNKPIKLAGKYETRVLLEYSKIGGLVFVDVRRYQLVFHNKQNPQFYSYETATGEIYNEND